ncbi:MAG: hypothetical protein ACM3XO_20840, partial [Bacteroidota bacterium]
MKIEKRWSLFVLLCLLTANLSPVQIVKAAPSGCSVIYTGTDWVIDTCTTDPNISTPMQVLLNGVSKGNAAVMRVYHKSQNDPGTPQVMVIYASGYIRLKQNANPTSAIPFGTSFILGPAYGTYNNPQLNRLEVDTALLPNAPLRMRAAGTNHDFAVAYEMTLPPPEDRQTRLHVSQTYTAVNAVSIDPTRKAERQGFKLVQASSMYINEGGSCVGGYTDCHDSNGVRFIGSNLARHQAAFAGLMQPAFIFGSPTPLGSTWIDVLHTDDQSWHSATGAGTSGNTPNVRIALDSLPPSHTITPQGWISPTTDPNQDNVGVWLHDDGPASTSWLKNQSDQIGYWLIAQDNPPDPWADLGLRTGSTFLDFEGTYSCFPVKDAAQSTTAAVSAINGFTDKAVQLNYNLGSNNNNWAQIRCNFNPPLNLSAYDHLRFEWRGDPAAGNSMQVGLINPAAGGEYIFARGYHHASQRGWWGQMVVPFSFLSGWTPGTQFDPSHVSAIFISVVKDGPDDNGGSGSIALDNLGANNLGSRTVPAAFDAVDANAIVAQAAANWIASQQQPTGLVKSWQEESSCVAHTYDQALALIVFASQGMWPQADALVNGLAAVQNADGSWFKSRNCINLSPLDSNKWEGDTAWMIYALGRYLALGGTSLQALTAQQKGAGWLATRVNPSDGCLVIDHTEGTIDAWWGFQSAGPSYAHEEEQIRSCLLTYYWDNGMGRFKGGRNWWQPYLDNQTWGAAFLKAIGESDKAQRALSYARGTLRAPAQGGQLFGFDGQAGPWSVWNEGTAQYVAVGGSGASDLLQELLAQQRWDGAMPSSPDEFNGGGVWTTRWHGVAPTAWLYNVLCGEPFHPGTQARCSVRRPPTPWWGGVSVSSNKNIVAVGRPHIGAEVASYDGFAQGSLSAYVPMLFRKAYGTYNSALYVQNVHASNLATVTIKYYDSEGILQCTKNDTIPALSSKGY